MYGYVSELNSGEAASETFNLYFTGTARNYLRGTTIFGESTNTSNIASGAAEGAYISGTGLLTSRNGTNERTHLTFVNNNGLCGTITTSGLNTAYNTESDHRLKENVVSMDDAVTRVQALNPVRFNFIADPTTTVDGFLAHEAQQVVPEAVTGEHNAVDEEGNPKYQGIDQSKLVPLLTKALQEALTEIDTLKSRLDALEGA